MHQFISILFQITITFIFFNNVYSENLKNEILIESDSMHIDELNSVSTFDGNVILKYGALSLLSDKVIISSGITGIVSKAVAEKDTIEVEIATGVYVNLLRANVTTILDNNSTISLPQKAPAKKSLQKTKKS